MHLKTRNVNTAFKLLVHMFKENVMIEKRPSRNGNVFMMTDPMVITYSHPKERVLFNAARDANPFFHLYEALWMLAGRNDVASVAYYAKQMNEYSDDGKILNGAYGYRWRTKQYIQEWSNHPNDYNIPKDWGKIDQLDILVQHLKADPNSRRAVLQMWNVEDDLLRISNSKDVCCNLSVMFSIRTIEDSYIHSKTDSPHHRDRKKITHYLDMTVTNRSNDLIWGLLGANYVHFTFLQEYMAARLGVEVGLYHHFTNNLHTYEWNWKPDEWLKAEPRGVEDGTYGYDCPVSGMQTVPFVEDLEVFEQELLIIVEHFNGVTKTNYEIDNLLEPFLRKVAGPALRAFQLHKLGETITGIRMCELIEADDWRLACTTWLERRKDKNAS